MKKYIVTFGSSNVKLLIAYNLENRLCEFVLEGDFTENQHNFILTKLPRTSDGIALLRQVPKLKVTEVEQDLSFGTFWDQYGHKVGNRNRAIKLWENMPPAEKALALAYIKKYNQFLLQSNGVQKLYPETYLNQKRYENG